MAGSESVAFYGVPKVPKLKTVKQLFASAGYLCKYGVQVEGCKLKQQGFQGNVVEGGKLRFKVEVIEGGKLLVKVEHFKQSSTEASGSPGRYPCPFYCLAELAKRPLRHCACKKKTNTWDACPLSLQAQ